MATKQRLDQALVTRALVATRSQAESYIKLGDVTVNGTKAHKPGQFVSETDTIVLTTDTQYVSRAGLKLASVAEILGLDFRNKVVLDVGSSTGGFTDYALKNGAKQVIAVDVGTDQLHPSLRTNPKVELHEKTDIRDIAPSPELSIDMVVIDVSFISLMEILPHIAKLINADSLVLAMAKPQFEATAQAQKHKGVIKNDSMRRDILKHLENRVQELFNIVDKRDSGVAGAKGNRERFYLLRPRTVHGK